MLVALPTPLGFLTRTSFFGPIFEPENPSQNLPFAEILKKAAANLVQLLLNPFIISICSTKITPEKREKTTQNRLFLLLFGLFRPFLAPPFCAFCRPFLPRLSALVCTPSSQRAKGKSRSVRAPIRAAPAGPQKPQSARDLAQSNRVSRGSPLNFVASQLFFIHSQPAQVCR